ncbi:cation:proton antiporter [Candidatus Woesearchaeota archaeon]|nr:cation:proton antiporter [Candidatus Woesearchaeota archaeon]
MIAADPLLIYFVIGSLVVLGVGLIMSYFKQPVAIAYILAGILFGPSVFSFFGNKDMISSLGNIGVVMLLFFIGMEISLPKLIAKWRIAIFGILVQGILSFAAMFMVGLWLGWPIGGVVLMSFVIVNGSTAILIKILQDKRQIDTKLGQNLLAILLVQDIAVVPMMIILSFFSEDKVSATTVLLQIIGAAILFSILYYTFTKGSIRLPFTSHIKGNHEIQVFGAFVLCFGLATISSLFNLSAGIGAFIAGILVSYAKETPWVKDSLESFRIVFVALFFVSIGMLINIDFLKQNVGLIMLLVAIVFILNTFINAGFFRLLGDSWRESLYSGALLSHIGEFSFVLSAVGLHSGIITQFGHELTVSIIAGTMLLGPIWVHFFEKLLLTRIKI